MAGGPTRGDIFWADLPEGEGSEQAGRRPVCVVSNDISNAFSPVVIVAAMTTKPSRNRQLWDVFLPAGQPTPREGRIMCNQLFTLDKRLLADKIGPLSAAQMVDLDRALKVALGLDGSVPAKPD